MTKPEKNQNSLGLYVHIPYCVVKCPYCDFNSYAIDPGLSEKTVAFEEQRYCSALIAELTHYSKSERFSERNCSSIFFGGGTPSIFSGESIERILNAINKHFPLQADCEISLEANPGTLKEELAEDKLRQFKNAGINRISIGAQSFVESKLKFLGRVHSAADIPNAIEAIKKVGFNSWNLDLIGGVKNETLEQWQSEIEKALSFNPPHIAAYLLTIEAGTPYFSRSLKGEHLQSDEDTCAEIYSSTASSLVKAGYSQYEISNYAKAGHGCKHNERYWTGGDYLGIGAGAHSYLSASNSSPGLRWQNVPTPKKYIEMASSPASAMQQSEAQTREIQMIEFFFLGFRRNAGISILEYQNKFSEKFSNRYQKIIDKHLSDKLIEATGDNLRLSDRGRLFANSVIESFASLVSE